MKKFKEIIDFNTLKQICYDSDDNELVRIYEEVNGLSFFKRDFKDITIPELTDYRLFLKRYEQFLNVLHETYGVEMERYVANEEFKVLLENLKKNRRNNLQMFLFPKNRYHLSKNTPSGIISRINCLNQENGEKIKV